eukprot:scaffold5980_cov376-Prasinococcus_capsulatus_cf.AAC.6
MASSTSTMQSDRRQAAFRVRVEAAEAARSRNHPEHEANTDEQRFAAANYAMSFTKGLDHDYQSGLALLRQDVEAFRTSINNGYVEPFTTSVPVPRDHSARTLDENGKVVAVERDQPPANSADNERRVWEAPTAGVVFDLQGPDAQAVTMPPAPPAGSNELAYEMAEVYELALLRDVPLSAFDNDVATTSVKLAESLGRLNELPYCTVDRFSGRPRMRNESGKIDAQTAFRGSAPGVEVGPYLSQFLLIGNQSRDTTKKAIEGFINYGANQINQRVPMAKCGDDYMTLWDDWFQVQQGFEPPNFPPGQVFTGEMRFICTPRDLATYVHFDALYQAYLNAALIMLDNKTPFDPNFDLLSGGREILVNAATNEKVPANAGGFALYGGPHILTLVTEVATRALKAVRYQKFNNHLRLRPEALAARLEKAEALDSMPSTFGVFGKMRKQIIKTVEQIQAHNTNLNGGEETALLPMAFGEGSPMHPAYGAGHATVAGACVTVLKAFFDTSAQFGINKRTEQPGFYASDDISRHLSYTAIGGETELQERSVQKPLTLEGELNKLAANISIGRNMAGVHYFTDYYDSVRMGEEVAIGMLQEQALCYSTDDFVLTLPTFDGKIIRIGAS